MARAVEAVAEACRRHQLNRKEQVLLLILAAEAQGSAGGECWPSYTRLQRHTGLTRRWVCSGLKVLKDKGLLSVRPPVKGERKSNTYELRVPGLFGSSGGTGSSGETSSDGGNGDRFHRGNCTGSTGGTRRNQDVTNDVTRGEGELPLNVQGEPEAPPARTPRKRGKAPAKMSPACAMVMAVLRYRLDEDLQREVDAIVKDLALWREVLREWKARGYRRSNVRGLLDWYANGGPPPAQHNGTRPASLARTGGGSVRETRPRNLNFYGRPIEEDD